MTTQVFEHEGVIYRPESALRRGLRRLRQSAGGKGVAVMAAAATAVLGVARAKAAPTVGHIREHAYSIIGFGMFDAAMFLHSEFTGLLVTGISWFVFEWKVQPEGSDGTS